MPDLLTRYRAGHREAVWHELRQFGAQVRTPDRIDEARAVCDEMARRARHNVEVVIARLVADGYHFHTNDDDRRTVPAHVPPTAEVEAHLSWLEALIGPVPLTLESWVRHVGDVWLVGTHPQWTDIAEADPLVIEAEGSRYPEVPIREYFSDDHANWREAHADDPASAGVFRLPLAPDALHKANVSGGPPAGMRLPDACADGLFGSECVEPFVDYLNRVFRHGGFPGTTSNGTAWRVRRRLSEGLLPL
jgi:hypothetical protein